MLQLSRRVSGEGGGQDDRLAAIFNKLSHLHISVLQLSKRVAGEGSGQDDRLAAIFNKLRQAQSF